MNCKHCRKPIIEHVCSYTGWAHDQGAIITVQCPSDAEPDDLMAQQAQPEDGAWMQVTCNSGGTGHLFMAHIKSGEPVPYLCKEHRQPHSIVHCRECSMIDCPGPSETE